MVSLATVSIANFFQKMDANFVQESYDRNYTLSNCRDLILEAKRVILNEQLDKIANITLSHINSDPPLPQYVTHACQNNVEWNNYINNELLNYKNETANVTSSDQPLEVPKKENSIKALRNLEYELGLMRKYYKKWKIAIASKSIEKESFGTQDKLDNFIQTLEKIKTGRSLRINEKHERHLGKPHSSFKNRFMAQKNIINLQKSKLEEQNKLIAELKLGIIREDILKSIENTKISIREIFAGCSERLKCKLPVVSIDERKFNINIQKAPKIVQQMEERAFHRAKNREIILQRKKLIEEMRQKILEEAIEKKRVLEDEERKRTLETMKEKRKKELELERIRQEKRRVYEEKLKISVEFHDKLLKGQCLRKLYNNLISCREKQFTAIEHYRKKVLRESLMKWLNFVDSLYIVKYETADALFTYKILKKYIMIWKEAHMESIRNMQVAEDLYDLRLTSNIFIHWYRYVCKQIVLEGHKMKIAEKYHKRYLIFHCFYQWRSLKAILELEKAKELKKQKWRERVWEILPDYKPPDIF